MLKKSEEGPTGVRMDEEGELNGEPSDRNSILLIKKGVDNEFEYIVEKSRVLKNFNRIHNFHL